MRSLPMLIAALVLGAACETPTPPPPDPAVTDAYTSAVATVDSIDADGHYEGDGHDHAPSAPRRVDLPTLPLLGGDSLRASDLRGSVVLLNYWATWCGPCREEMPDLAALHREHAEDGFTVVGLSLDTDEPAFVSAFVDKFTLPYPIVLDPQALSANAAGGVYGLPTSILLNRDGSVAWRANGLITREEAEPLIVALLAE